MTAPNEITVKLPLYKFQTLMHHYVRDSLHDHGSKVLRCIYDVKDYWAVLGSDAREAIEREIKFFIKEYHHLRNDAFFKNDLNAWGELVEWIDGNRDSTTPKFTGTQPHVPIIPVIDPKQREK